MSVNYNNNGQLVNIGNTRVWIGTKAAHNALVTAGKMPNNCMVYLIDNVSGQADTTPTKDSTNLITSGGVYNALYVDNFTYKVESSLIPKLQFYGVTSTTGTGAFRRLKINDKISILDCANIATVGGPTQTGEARCTLFFPKTTGKNYRLISFVARQSLTASAYVSYNEFVAMTNDWRVDFYMENCTVNNAIHANLSVIEYS